MRDNEDEQTVYLRNHEKSHKGVSIKTTMKLAYTEDSKFKGFENVHNSYDKKEDNS